MRYLKSIIRCGDTWKITFKNNSIFVVDDKSRWGCASDSKGEYRFATTKMLNGVTISVLPLDSNMYSEVESITTTKDIKEHVCLLPNFL